MAPHLRRRITRMMGQKDSSYEDDEKYEPCPRLRSLSLRNIGCGKAGAKALNKALNEGACKELRDLALTGNRIGDESIRGFEVTTGSRPLLRITASRAEPLPQAFYLVSLLLVWPFMTTILIMVSLSMRHSGDHSTAILYLRSKMYQGPESVYRSFADIIDLSQAAFDSRNTSIYFIPGYLITAPMRRPKFLEQFKRVPGGEMTLASTICPEIRAFVEREKQNEMEYDMLDLPTEDGDHTPSSSSATLPESKRRSNKRQTIPDIWVRLLIGWPEFVNYCLAKPPLGDHGISVLAAGVGENRLQVLESLSMVGQNIEPSGLNHLTQAFNQSPQLLSHLKHVDLSGNPLDLQSLTAFLEKLGPEGANSTGCLHHLHLDYTGVGILAAQAIAKSMQRPDCMQHLTLREPVMKKKAGQPHAHHVLESVRNMSEWFGTGACQSLETLSLSGNHLIGDAGLARLLDGMTLGKCHSLTTLDLSYTGLSEASTHLLLKHLKHGGILSQLVSLNLAGNQLYFRGAQNIFKAVIGNSATSSSLSHLNLAFTGIRHWALRCSALKPDQLLFSPIIGHPSSLKILELQGNHIGRCDVATLSRAFGARGTLVNLKELDISDCGLGEAAIKALSSALEDPLDHHHPSGVGSLSSTCRATFKEQSDSGGRSQSMKEEGREHQQCQVSTDENGRNVDSSPQQCESRPALQVLRLGSNHFSTKVAMGLLKTLGKPSSGLPSLTELDLSWSLTNLAGPLDFTATLTGPEASSITSRLPIARPSIRRLALAGACGCGPLKMLDLRTGDENHARAYRVDRLVMATPTLLPNNCALPCLRNVNVVLSTVA